MLGKDAQLMLVGLVLAADDYGRELAHGHPLGKQMGYILTTPLEQWTLWQGASLANRSVRLKTLGNAVMPQQIYPILKAIVEIEQTYSETDVNYLPSGAGNAALAL